MSTVSAIRSLFVAGAASAADELVRQENLAVSEGLKRQDVGLLDQLIVRYQHRLLRYLLFLTGNREMAEDMFQEVWMRVLTRGGQFNGKARFETWLFTIARNLVIDQRRKRTMSSLDEIFEAGGDDDKPMTFEVADHEPGPFDRMSNVEDRQQVAIALLQLDTLYREVLVLRFHEDLSLEEIAKVTRAPLSTVKSRLYRGMASIKPHLERARRITGRPCDRTSAVHQSGQGAIDAWRTGGGYGGIWCGTRAGYGRPDAARGGGFSGSNAGTACGPEAGSCHGAGGDAGGVLRGGPTSMVGGGDADRRRAPDKPGERTGGMGLLLCDCAAGFGIAGGVVAAQVVGLSIQPSPMFSCPNISQILTKLFAGQSPTFPPRESSRSAASFALCRISGP